MDRTKFKTEVAILRALPKGSQVIINEFTLTKIGDKGACWGCHSMIGGRKHWEGYWNCAAVAMAILQNPSADIG